MKIKHFPYFLLIYPATILSIKLHRSECKKSVAINMGIEYVQYFRGKIET